VRHTCIVRDCQGLSETLRNWKRLYCTCTVLALLQIHLNSVYSNPVVVFSRSKDSMWISVEQYLSRIGLHNHFVNAKDALSCFKDQFWNMMRMAPITDNDVVLRKICYNSRSQDINSHAKIETTCYTVQNVEWTVMLWLTQMMCYDVYSVCSITYKANKWCGGKSKPYNFWCPWFDRHFLGIRACIKWMCTPTEHNALNVNTI